MSISREQYNDYYCKDKDFANPLCWACHKRVDYYMPKSYYQIVHDGFVLYVCTDCWFGIAGDDWTFNI